MNVLCTGLAIWGLCIPLPGHSLDAVSRAGWAVQRAEMGALDWWTSRSMATEDYRLVATVSGHGDVVSAVTIGEKVDAVQHPLRDLTEKSCTGADGGAALGLCRLTGRQFAVFRCPQYWTILPPSAVSKPLTEKCLRLR